MAAPGGVPKPAPVPWCPGRLPAPVRRRNSKPWPPLPETARKRLFTDRVALGGGGVRGGPHRGVLGGWCHTRSTPPPSTTPDLWGQNSPAQRFASFLPTKKKKKKLNFQNAALPFSCQTPPPSPGQRPLRQGSRPPPPSGMSNSGPSPCTVGRMRPPGEVQGGAHGGHWALPAAAAPTHKRFGGWEARGGRCAPIPSAHPRCPMSPLSPSVPPPRSPATQGGVVGREANPSQKP